MLKNEKQEKLFKAIPTQYKIRRNNNVYDLNVHKRYTNQLVQDEFPTIGLTYTTTGIVSYSYLNDLYCNTQRTTDTFIYTDDSYTLSSTPSHIIHVYGNYAEEGEYVYGEVPEHMYNVVDDEIIFLESLEEGTKFYVIYSHEQIKVVLGGEFLDRIQIDVFTTDMELNGTYMNGSYLNKSIVNQLRNYLDFGLSFNDMVIRDVSSTMDLSQYSGNRYEYRRQFTIEIAYHDTFVEYYDTIQEVDYALNMQVK